MKLNRDFYTSGLIRNGAALEILDDLKVELYRYEARGKFAVAMFGGRRAKPDQHYIYSTEAAREAAIERYLDTARANAEYTATKRATRSNPHTLAIGDVLYTSWGYDQTNVDFFQVVAKPSKCFVVIREIASTIVESNGPSERVIADLGNFTGVGRRVKANADNTVRISDGRGSAWAWDGNSKHQTGAGYGH